MPQWRLPPALEPLAAAAARRARGPLYIVGGALRDALLGRESSDLDLAYQGPARALAAELARLLKGTLVVLDDRTQVFRVALKGGLQVDVARLQGKDILADLTRRDFTVNAIAMDAGRPGEWIDPRGGLRDLKRRLLRTDDPEVFREDPLRLLRAFRIAARLGLAIEPRTLAMIRTHRGLARKPAGERIRAELMGILSCGECHSWLRLMDKAGLLTALWPELEKSRGCARAYYGEGGVLRHTLDAVERADFLLEDLDRAFPGLGREIRGCFQSWERAAPLVRLAVLLHDVAKPATARRIKGRLRFFGHDVRGARMAERELERLRFSREETELVRTCILHHLRPGNLAHNASVSDKAVFRFFRDLGRHGVAQVLVSWADHASYLDPRRLRSVLKHAREDPNRFRPKTVKNPDTAKTLRHLQVLHLLLRSFFTRPDRVAPKPLLNGHEVMRLLGVPPGPAVGRALERLAEAQAEGKAADKEGAARFLKRLKLR